MFLVKSLVIAFAMYSKIPMPKVEWNEKNMRYALCFFPMVGMVEGAIVYAFWKLFLLTDRTGIMAAAVLTTLPILITGGIHMDGFLDTIDALSSYQSKERKLEILKDSHTGAFAIIGAVVYLMLYFGGIYELHTEKQYQMLWIVFILSRTLSALAIVFFKGAKKDGLMYAFSSTAHTNAVRWSLGVLLLVSLGILCGIELSGAIQMGIVAALLFIYYRKMSYRQFGGITGDLAGFFLQLCELLLLYVLVFL